MLYQEVLQFHAKMCLEYFVKLITAFEITFIACMKKPPPKCRPHFCGWIYFLSCPNHRSRHTKICPLETRFRLLIWLCSKRQNMSVLSVSLVNFLFWNWSSHPQKFHHRILEKKEKTFPSLDVTFNISFYKKFIIMISIRHNFLNITHIST